jgi:diaminopimelate epimerase
MIVSKYHGLGNDFIMAQLEDVAHLSFSKLAQKLCDRHTGIGADGLIVINKDPLEMIYYNSDGSRAEMCGNGIRCFVKYGLDLNVITEDVVTVNTLAGPYKIEILSKEPFECKVNMGQGQYEPGSYSGAFKEEVLDQDVTLGNKDFRISALLMGVPHAVLETKSWDSKDLIQTGSFIESAPEFLEGTNVNFVEVVSSDHIKMQTFERGAGLTLACGTGACATFDALYKIGKVNDIIRVQLPLGELVLEHKDDSVFMTGPAEKVCDCIIEEDHV